MLGTPDLFPLVPAKHHRAPQSTTRTHHPPPTEACDPSDPLSPASQLLQFLQCLRKTSFTRAPIRIPGQLEDPRQRTSASRDTRSRPATADIPAESSPCPASTSPAAPEMKSPPSTPDESRPATPALAAAARASDSHTTHSFADTGRFARHNSSSSIRPQMVAVGKIPKRKHRQPDQSVNEILADGGNSRQVKQRTACWNRNLNRDENIQKTLLDFVSHSRSANHFGPCSSLNSGRARIEFSSARLAETSAGDFSYPSRSLRKLCSRARMAVAFAAFFSFSYRRTSRRSPSADTSNSRCSSCTRQLGGKSFNSCGVGLPELSSS